MKKMILAFALLASTQALAKVNVKSCVAKSSETKEQLNTLMAATMMGLLPEKFVVANLDASSDCKELQAITKILVDGINAQQR